MYSDLLKQGLRFKENIQAWFPQKEQEHQAERKIGGGFPWKKRGGRSPILFYYFVLYIYFNLNNILLLMGHVTGQLL